MYFYRTRLKTIFIFLYFVQFSVNITFYYTVLAVNDKFMYNINIFY